MMLASCEVRWFFPGDPPEKMTRWFRAGLAPAAPTRRVDRYLLMPGCEGVGIKLREGAFEIKARCGSAETCAYPNGVRGLRDCWVKWSRALHDPRALLPAAEERWVAVAKRRALRRFSLDGVAVGEDPREIDAHAGTPQRGCGVELTRVELIDAESSRWWTLGLEAFDEHGDARASLERVATYLFDVAPPPVALEVESSSAYPGWLLRYAPASEREV